MDKTTLQKAFAVFLALLLWHIAAVRLDLGFLLVSPIEVAGRLLTIWFDPEFWPTIANSLLRLLQGFGLAFAAACIMAAIAGRFRIVEILLWPYIVTVTSVPLISFIIIFLIWLSSSQLAVFISFLIVFPVIYSNVLEGIKSTDPMLLEMARLYKVPWGRRILFIYLPNIKPFIVSSCSVAVGMAWRSVVAAEVLGIVSGSVGEKLYMSKIYLETCELFAWSAIIVLVSSLLGKLFMFILNKAFARLEKI